MTALIFDLDGVVADTSEAHYRSWQQLADEEGLTFDRAANAALLGLTREHSFAVLLGGRSLGEVERDAWLARKQRYFLAELARMGPQDLLPGVGPLLAAAQAAAVPCALASSSRNARAVLAQLGITDRFAIVADGASVARPKPAPDIFCLVAAQLGLAPHRCLVIEDSPAGVKAALAGGFALVSVGPAVRTPHHFATLGKTVLADLLEILDAEVRPPPLSRSAAGALARA